MNRGIIKNFKLKIYNTDSPNNPQKYTNDILYYIIYLITFIVKNLSKKKIWNTKKKMKKKRIERVTDP